MRERPRMRFVTLQRAAVGGVEASSGSSRAFLLCRQFCCAHRQARHSSRSCTTGRAQSAKWSRNWWNARSASPARGALVAWQNACNSPRVGQAQAYHTVAEWQVAHSDVTRLCRALRRREVADPRLGFLPRAFLLPALQGAPTAACGRARSRACSRACNLFWKVNISTAA